MPWCECSSSSFTSSSVELNFSENGKPINAKLAENVAIHPILKPFCFNFWTFNLTFKYSLKFTQVPTGWKFQNTSPTVLYQPNVFYMIPCDSPHKTYLLAFWNFKFKLKKSMFNGFFGVIRWTGDFSKRLFSKSYSSNSFASFFNQLICGSTHKMFS